MKKVYSIPYDGELEEFEVIKETKKDMVLRNKRGRELRITPSQFHLYHDNPWEAVRRARGSIGDRIKHANKTLSKLIALDEKLWRLQRIIDGTEKREGQIRA